MPRTATIGPAVYERVNELVGEGKNRTEAFQAIAQERGMNAGTVSANFYRTAGSQAGSTRSRGAAKTRRRRAAEVVAAPSPTARRTQARRSPTRASTTKPPAPQGDVAALAAQIGDLVQQLVRQVKERDRLIRDLVG
jgi:HAMP domain-containing protein